MGKKLLLSRQSVKALTDRRMARVVGGISGDACTGGCESQYYYTCRGSCDACSASHTGYNVTCQGACSAEETSPCPSN